MESYKVVPERGKQRRLYVRWLLNSNQISSFGAESVRKSSRRGNRIRETRSYSTIQNITWSLAFTKCERRGNWENVGLISEKMEFSSIEIKRFVEKQSFEGRGRVYGTVFEMSIRQPNWDVKVSRYMSRDEESGIP